MSIGVLNQERGQASAVAWYFGHSDHGIVYLSACIQAHKAVRCNVSVAIRAHLRDSPRRWEQVGYHGTDEVVMHSRAK